MTVHDIGKNHTNWLNFVHHPSMVHVKERAIFIHVDLLGQEDEAEDLAADCKYPTMQQVRGTKLGTHIIMDLRRYT